MKRRTFLKSVLGTGAAAGGYLFRNPLKLAMNEAQAAPQRPALVVIFQRGGCDGLNSVVPYGDPAYRDLRPSIAIARPDDNAPNRAIDLDGFFGLHPSLEPLAPIYRAGNMAVLPSVQYPSPSRSHFRSQFFIESGRQSDESDGWLNRFLAATEVPSPMRAAHFGGSLAQALKGPVPVSSFSSINGFNLGLSATEEQTLIDALGPVYDQDPSPDTHYRRLVQDFGRKLFGDLEIAQGVDPTGYEPANGALYPDTSYGRRLREIAQLLKSPGVELELATVDIGGWDTHSNQGGGEPEGRLSRRLAEFSAGIRALYEDLGSLRDQVMILTMTEFGRTCKENGSGGTDHGIASSWFLFGDRVNGGIYNGPGGWPGLSEQDMVNGRFLNHTVNHRDLMGEILWKHLGAADLAGLLPGHVFQDQGLIA